MRSLMNHRLSKVSIPANIQRILALTPRTRQTRNGGDELPLPHRLARIYLMVPLIIWLVSWFHLWLGIPAAVLTMQAFWTALSGFSRLSSPRPMTLAILIVAAGWVMSAAAGGLLDTDNYDWIKHRLLLPAWR